MSLPLATILLHFLTLKRLLILMLLILPCSFFDDEYLVYNYCQLNCEKAPHSACECQIKAPREEIVDRPTIEEWRKKMVFEHNFWRNQIAGGLEKRPKPGVFPQATNMLQMYYDMEMEHIARCYGINNYNHLTEEESGHDICRDRMGPEIVGQNLWGSSKYNATKMQNFDEEGHWYSEVNYMDLKTVKSFTETENKTHHFTQVVWWSADRVGCVRIKHPANIPSWTYTLICNYASTINDVPGNRQNDPLYEFGPPCSHCPDGVKCNPESKFPYLCAGAEMFFGSKTALMGLLMFLFLSASIRCT